jgi:hypothetical protein
VPSSALFTAGLGEGFLLPKNMTLKTVDGELNTQDFSISITNQSAQPVSFVFYDVAEVDWLIGQLKGIRSNIQTTDREIRKRVTFLKCSSRIDPVEHDYTQLTKEEATLRFAELRKSISEI